MNNQALDKVQRLVTDQYDKHHEPNRRVEDETPATTVVESQINIRFEKGAIASGGQLVVCVGRNANAVSRDDAAKPDET